jgi:hypothetical protein
LPSQEPILSIGFFKEYWTIQEIPVTDIETYLEINQAYFLKTFWVADKNRRIKKNDYFHEELCNNLKHLSDSAIDSPFHPL